ncbi:hypothetical protein DFH08DRAFT_734563 [Mycena albidolilacea]|uniref:Uncharacterized protein n=1 Tax=Mycena albidolilacea TaxID=1033008 RepID=A0AAD7F112_9AGAR|nr:hypothetical protein DFH08DRAFT_734563 [Mycena albidolilacea]
MVFRLPTHLDNLIPPPSTQAPASAARPWRGTLAVRGMRPSDLGSNQEIRVTAVETDGDSDVRRWPRQFFAQLTHGRPILNEVRAWIRQHAPPISTFMPDRLPDPDTNVVNLTTFRSLSRMLFENQIVAIAGWGTDTFPGGGIIIIPAEHSSALLVAALFFSQFPDIITTRLNTPSSPLITTQSQHHTLYTQPMQPMSSTTTPISPLYAQSASGSRQIPSPTSYRRSRHDGSLSPIEQPISRSRQEQYRSHPAHPAHPHPQIHAAWPAPSDDDDKQYSHSPYSAHPGSHPHSHSRYSGPPPPPPRTS